MRYKRDLFLLCGYAKDCILNRILLSVPIECIKTILMKYDAIQRRIISIVHIQSNSEVFIIYQLNTI